MISENQKSQNLESRKGCYFLLIFFPALIVCYFVLLHTNFFDIKPGYYPDLENFPAPAGPTITLIEALESSDQWDDWLAWQESSDRELIEELMVAVDESREAEPVMLKKSIPQLLRAEAIFRDVVARPESLFRPPYEINDRVSFAATHYENRYARELTEQIVLLHSLAKYSEYALSSVQNLTDLMFNFLIKQEPNISTTRQRSVWLQLESHFLQSALAETYIAATASDEGRLAELAAMVGKYRSTQKLIHKNVFIGDFIFCRSSYAHRRREMLDGEDSSSIVPKFEIENKWIGCRIQPNRTVEGLAEKQRRFMQLSSLPARDRKIAESDSTDTQTPLSPAANVLECAGTGSPWRPAMALWGWSIKGQSGVALSLASALQTGALSAAILFLGVSLSPAAGTIIPDDSLKLPWEGNAQYCLSCKCFGVRRQREPLATGDGALGVEPSKGKAASRYRLPPNSKQVPFLRQFCSSGHRLSPLRPT